MAAMFSCWKYEGTDLTPPGCSAPLEQLSSGLARNISKYLPGQEPSVCSPYLFCCWFFFALLQWIELSSYNWKQNLACHHCCFLWNCFKRITTVNPFCDCSECREFLPGFWYAGAVLELFFGDKKNFQDRHVRRRHGMLIHFEPDICDLCKWTAVQSTEQTADWEWRGMCSALCFWLTGDHLMFISPIWIVMLTPHAPLLRLAGNKPRDLCEENFPLWELKQ